MKKLLMLFFVGFLSVSLVGMDDDDQTDNNNNPTIINGNLKGGRGKRKEDNYSSDERRKTAEDYLWDEKSVNVINPQFFMLPPEAQKSYTRRLFEKTEAYIIDGIAQNLAQPIVGVITYPLILAQIKVLEWWYKDEREKNSLAQAQQDYLKTLSKDTELLFGNITKKDSLTKHLKDMIQERNLDPSVIQKLEGERQSLIAELQEKLSLGFEARLKEGTLTEQEQKYVQSLHSKQQELMAGGDADPEEIVYELNAWFQEKLFLGLQERLQKNTASQEEKVMMSLFVEKQKALAQKVQHLVPEDIKLMTNYTDARTTMRDDIYENLDLIKKQNRMSKMTRDNLYATVGMLEEAAHKKEEAARKKKEELRRVKLAVDLEYENRKTLKNEQWAREQEEHERNKKNEIFLWNQRHAVK